jgi:hypothetical protein
MTESIKLKGYMICMTFVDLLNNYKTINKQII